LLTFPFTANRKAAPTARSTPVQVRDDLSCPICHVTGPCLPMVGTRVAQGVWTVLRLRGEGFLERSHRCRPCPVPILALWAGSVVPTSPTGRPAEPGRSAGRAPQGGRLAMDGPCPGTWGRRSHGQGRFAGRALMFSSAVHGLCVIDGHLRAGRCRGALGTAVTTG
jgi:hypothetical protein